MSHRRKHKHDVVPQTPVKDHRSTIFALSLSLLLFLCSLFLALHDGMTIPSIIIDLHALPPETPLSPPPSVSGQTVGQEQNTDTSDATLQKEYKKNIEQVNALDKESAIIDAGINDTPIYSQ